MNGTSNSERYLRNCCIEPRMGLLEVDAIITIPMAMSGVGVVLYRGFVHFEEIA